MQLNVNGIKGKFKKLNELARDYNVDVVVVSELKTNHYHTFDRAEFDHMIGYTLYLDSARCAVYVRQELQKHTKHITVGDEKQTEDARFPEDVFHCCAVSISDASTQQKLLVVSCYRSPSAVSGNTTDVFEKVSQVPGDYTHTIVAGDFNVHHVRLGSQKTDAAGRRLLGFFGNLQFLRRKRRQPDKGQDSAGLNFGRPRDSGQRCKVEGDGLPRSPTITSSPSTSPSRLRSAGSKKNVVGGCRLLTKSGTASALSQATG